MEQRYRAVLEVLEDGVAVTEVACRYGVVRQTVHTWLRRYAEGGTGALADRPARPGSCPHQMAAVTEARVVRLRREYPGWGPSRLRWELERAGVTPLPGRSAVYRALVRHGLVEARRREDCRRWERPRAMDLWQMDVMGRVFLAGGAEVKIVTGSMTIPGSWSARRRCCGRRPGRCARPRPVRCGVMGCRPRS